ncbi:MAG: hypothetical protein N2B02_08075, partial [Amylibacter sp.]
LLVILYAPHINLLSIQNQKPLHLQRFLVTETWQNTKSTHHTVYRNVRRNGKLTQSIMIHVLSFVAFRQQRNPLVAG